MYFIIGLSIFVFLLYIGLLIYFNFKLKSSTNISLLFSPIERLSVNLGFTLTPLFLISIAFIPIYFIKNKLSDLYRNKSLLILLVIILLSSVLSIIFSDFKLQAVKSTIYMFIYLLIIFVQYNILIKIKNKDKLYFSIVVAMFVFSLYALIQYIRYKFNLYPDIFNINIPYNNSLNPLNFDLNNHTELRPNSGFNDVNTSAGYISIFLPILIFYLFSSIKNVSKNKKFKSYTFIIFTIITILLNVVIFYLMFSRSSFIALFLSSVFIFIICIFKILSKTQRKVAILLSLTTILISGIFLFNPVIEYSKRLYNSEYSFQAHLAYTDYAIKLFKNNIIFGSGTGTFGVNYLTNQDRSVRLESVDNPPQYIKYLAEQGIVGLFSYLALYVYLVIKGIKYLYSRNVFIESLKMLCLMTGLGCMLLGAFFHAYLSLYFVAIFISLYLALSEDANFNNKL